MSDSICREIALPSIIVQIRMELARASAAGEQAIAHLTAADASLERALDALIGAADESRGVGSAARLKIGQSRHALTRIVEDIGGATRDAVDWGDRL